VITWPDDLVSAVSRRRSVIFLGAGISLQCANVHGDHPKAWADLLRAAVTLMPGTQTRKRDIRGLIRQGDYLTACEVIREGMGPHAFYNFLTQELFTPNFQPAPIHDSIIQLGSRVYATPNFDKVLENKAGTLPDTPFRVKNYYDDDIAAVTKGSQSTILKLHGSIDVPDRIVFTRADYTQARNKYWQFYSILESLSLTHTFLFLGCGLNDPDIKLILEDHAFTHKWAAPHYFVLSESSIPRSIIPAVQKNLNIVILEYTGGHGQLKLELDVLVTAVLQKRIGMQLDMSW
jgi:hypothetical protein